MESEIRKYAFFLRVEFRNKNYAIEVGRYCTNNSKNVQVSTKKSIVSLETA